LRYISLNKIHNNTQMKEVPLMLLLVYSTPILGIILHHRRVFFSCYHTKVSFQPTSCTFHVFIFHFHELHDLDLKTRFGFVMVGSCPSNILLSSLISCFGQ
jgi:hypothetical protein